MEYALLPALFGFAFVTSITPGPNNLMLMASGANFGLRRSLPHMLGVGLGFAVLATAVGAGLSEAFALFPPLRLVLKAASVVFMLWLAWKIALASPVRGAAEGKRPLSFLQAAGFQWMNPKAWAMATTAMSVYLPVPGIAGVAVVAGAFLLVSTCSTTTWVIAGRSLARLLREPRHLRVFNVVMALLLLASLWPLLHG